MDPREVSKRFSHSCQRLFSRGVGVSEVLRQGRGLFCGADDLVSRLRMLTTLRPCVTSWWSFQRAPGSREQAGITAADNGGHGVAVRAGPRTAAGSRRPRPGPAVRRGAPAAERDGRQRRCSRRSGGSAAQHGGATDRNDLRPHTPRPNLGPFAFDAHSAPEPPSRPSGRAARRRRNA